MKHYLRNRWIQVGLALVVLGWGPLFTIIALADLGLWPDPNPNPIGPGLLFFVTAWPAIGCLTIGVLRVRAGKSANRDGPTSGPLAEGSQRRTMLRAVSGILGFLFALNGLGGLIAGTNLRGPASALLVGAVALYWSITDRFPGRTRR